MLYQPVTITADVLTRVLRATGTGEPHITLASAAVWHDPETDHAGDRTAWQVIADAGLCDETGFDRDLADSLAVLAWPTVEFYGWITHNDHTTAVLGAAIGADALLAVRQGDRIRLTPADPRRLAEMLIGCLPDVPPGRGVSATLPLATVRAELNPHHHALPGGVLQAVLPGTAPAVAPLTRLASLPATGAGELYTAVRGRNGVRRPSLPQAVTYQDTVEGRWLIQVVPGHGEEWVVVAPATPALLLNRLLEAHTALRPAQTVGFDW